MRITRTAVLASALFFGQPASAEETTVEAPINRMVAAFNKGDIGAARATHVASPAIIDEVGAPFVWSGPNAFDAWIGALSKAEAAAGKSDGSVAIGPPTRESVSGDHAYVIVPSTYTFKQRGKTMREVGTMTFALIRNAQEWLIAGWTWTSPEAAPVQ